MSKSVRGYRLLIGLLFFTATASARAGIVPDVTVRVVPAALSANLGDTFAVDIVADINMPVVGWGLDLSFSTPGIVSTVGMPMIASPTWLAAASNDGDGLSAVADFLLGSVSGLNITLATLTLSADTLGTTDLLLGVTDGDLTEGFALDPSGFAQNVVFESSHIEVLPEPATALLLVLASPIALRRRR